MNSEAWAGAMVLIAGGLALGYMTIKTCTAHTLFSEPTSVCVRLKGWVE